MTDLQTPSVQPVPLAAAPLKATPLFELHNALGAKIVPFAGYAMPVQYALGVKAEHLHTREKAGLFDVSHMGQFLVDGPGAAKLLESLLPIDLDLIAIGQQQYTQFTNEQGGILDDLIVCRWAQEQFFLVVNAACKEQDFAWIEQHISDDTVLTELVQQALIALQGPQAVDVLTQLAPGVEQLRFMHGKHLAVAGIEAFVTRSGYTGEDGFEISVASEHAEALAKQLLAFNNVEAIGLGARDTLRLEAGLCLYGHELDTSTSPVAAGLVWSIAKSRRTGGVKEGGFPGASKILNEIDTGTPLKRVGLEVLGRAPVRDGATLIDADSEACGEVCSGGFGPSINAPITMAYVAAQHATPGTLLHTELRGRTVGLRVCKLPFVPHQYQR